VEIGADHNTTSLRDFSELLTPSSRGLSVLERTHRGSRKARRRGGGGNAVYVGPQRVIAALHDLKET